MSDTRLILHVKGTEAQTTELPRRIVRAAISCGQITHSQLIWSPTHNAWKQVREMPDLLPSQKLAPMPRPAQSAEAIQPDAPNNPVARAVAAGGTPVPKPRVASGAVPKVVAAGGSGPVPKVRVAAAGAPKPQVKMAAVTASAAPRSAKVEEDHDFHPIKWICIGLGVLILLVLGVNYIFVDHPLNSKLSSTPYAKVTAYAHLGAFMQPNVLIIHVPPSAQLNADNLSDFLSALAGSTPRNPLTANLYDRVAITSGWTAQYSFSGEKWKELGSMGNQEDEQRRDFILSQIADPAGTPLIRSSGSQDAIEHDRDALWSDLVSHFTKGQQ